MDTRIFDGIEQQLNVRLSNWRDGFSLLDDSDINRILKATGFSKPDNSSGVDRLHDPRNIEANLHLKLLENSFSDFIKELRKFPVGYVIHSEFSPLVLLCNALDTALLSGSKIDAYGLDEELILNNVTPFMDVGRNTSHSIFSSHIGLGRKWVRYLLSTSMKSSSKATFEIYRVRNLVIDSISTDSDTYLKNRTQDMLQEKNLQLQLQDTDESELGLDDIEQYKKVFPLWIEQDQSYIEQVISLLEKVRDSLARNGSSLYVFGEHPSLDRILLDLNLHSASPLSILVESAGANIANDTFIAYLGHSNLENIVPPIPKYYGEAIFKNRSCNCLITKNNRFWFIIALGNACVKQHRAIDDQEYGLNKSLHIINEEKCEGWSLLYNCPVCNLTGPLRNKLQNNFDFDRYPPKCGWRTAEDAYFPPPVLYLVDKEVHEKDDMSMDSKYNKYISKQEYPNIESSSPVLLQSINFGKNLQRDLNSGPHQELPNIREYHRRHVEIFLKPGSEPKCVSSGREQSVDTSLSAESAFYENIYGQNVIHELECMPETSLDLNLLANKISEIRHEIELQQQKETLEATRQLDQIYEPIKTKLNASADDVLKEILLTRPTLEEYNIPPNSTSLPCLEDLTAFYRAKIQCDTDENSNKMLEAQDQVVDELNLLLPIDIEVLFGEVLSSSNSNKEGYVQYAVRAMYQQTGQKLNFVESSPNNTTATKSCSGSIWELAKNLPKGFVMHSVRGNLWRKAQEAARTKLLVVTSFITLPQVNALYEDLAQSVGFITSGTNGHGEISTESDDDWFDISSPQQIDHFLLSKFTVHSELVDFETSGLNAHFDRLSTRFKERAYLKSGAECLGSFMRNLLFEIRCICKKVNDPLQSSYFVQSVASKFQEFLSPNSHNESKTFIVDLGIEPEHLSLEIGKDILDVSTMLEHQDYRCAGCSTSFEDERKSTFSVIKSKPYWQCNLTGAILCKRLCHSAESKRIIPVRAICRWDIEPKKVCDAASKWLDFTYRIPMFTITENQQVLIPSEEDNDLGGLFEKAAKIVGESRTLRLRLHAFMQKYYTEESEKCSIFNSIVLTHLTNRLHLVMDVDLYSLEDIKDMRNKILVMLLNETVTALASHIERPCHVCTSTKVYLVDSKLDFASSIDSPDMYSLPLVQCKKCGTLFPEGSNYSPDGFSDLNESVNGRWLYNFGLPYEATVICQECQSL